MPNFIVVVEKEYVRDVQIAPIPEQKDNEDQSGWKDAFGHLVLGVYEGTNEHVAIGKAALENEVSGETLVAYQLADVKYERKTPAQLFTEQEIEFIITEGNPEAFSEQAVDDIMKRIEEISEDIEESVNWEDPIDQIKDHLRKYEDQ